MSRSTKEVSRAKKIDWRKVWARHEKWWGDNEGASWIAQFANIEDQFPRGEIEWDEVWDKFEKWWKLHLNYPWEDQQIEIERLIREQYE